LILLASVMTNTVYHDLLAIAGAKRPLGELCDEAADRIKQFRSDSGLAHVGAANAFGLTRTLRTRLEASLKGRIGLEEAEVMQAALNALAEHESQTPSGFGPI
jgi:hypothetical protein